MNLPAPAYDDEKLVMLREIALQPQFMRSSVAGSIERGRVAFAAHAGRRITLGFLVGCGDSYFAGLAARAYVAATSQCWIEPVEALEFCGYLVPSIPADSVVIGVSNSGQVARTIEAVRGARAGGAWTFAITAQAQSELALRAESVVQIDAVPNIKQRADGTKLVTPGTLTYTASLLGIYATAIALGEHVHHLSAAAVHSATAQLERVAAWMEEADGAVTALAPQLALTFSSQRTTVVVGGGPNYATALYGAAKWYEALQWPAHAAQIEEWAHQHYFFTGAATDTIVLLPPGSSRLRGLEQLRAARDMASRTIVIAERDDAAAERAADIFVPMPTGIPEALTPFVYKVPFEYLCAHIAAAQGRNFFGFNDPLRQQVNFRQIFDVAPAERVQ